MWCALHNTGSVCTLPVCSEQDRTVQVCLLPCSILRVPQRNKPGRLRPLPSCLFAARKLKGGLPIRNERKLESHSVGMNIQTSNHTWQKKNPLHKILKDSVYLSSFISLMEHIITFPQLQISSLWSLLNVTECLIFLSVFPHYTVNCRAISQFNQEAGLLLMILQSTKISCLSSLYLLSPVFFLLSYENVGRKILKFLLNKQWTGVYKYSIKEDMRTYSTKDL